MKNAYEQMKIELTTALIDKLPKETIEAVMKQLDITAASYSIELKSTALIRQEDAAPRLVRQYIATKMMEGISQNTVDNYKRTLISFFRFCKKQPADVEPNDIRMYVYWYQNEREEKVDNITLNNYIRFIKYFFGWAQDNEYIAKNPAKSVCFLKCEQKHRQAMTRRDLILLINACKTDKERAIINMMYATGCRISEAVSIRLDDIDWREKTISVIGKGRKHRDLLFNEAAEISMRIYLDNRKQESGYLFCSDRANDKDRQLTTAGMRRIINDIGDRAGVSVHLTPHIIRHTTATLALDAGMPVEQVQRLLGHSQIETTMHYIDLNQDTVRQSYSKHVI